MLWSKMHKTRYIKFITALMIYAAFAVYLYQPYFEDFGPPQYLPVLNACLASLGCYVLSRRWVSAFGGSFFAGAIYGFGPFTLGLAKYHPTAGLLAASIPWLFCPAAFGPKGRWRWVNWPLATLPFLVVLLFFQISAHYRLFVVPIRAKLHSADLAGLLAPLVMAERNAASIGFYHVPIAALIMGFAMLLAARRLSVIAILLLGTVLAFCNSLLGVSPIIWLSIAVLCCSVIIGAGIQGLASAGYADRKWVLLTAMIMAALSIVTLLLATKYFQIFAGLGAKYAKLLVETAKMYILGSVAAIIIFFIARAKLQLRWLRWIVLCSAMAIDIFLGARFIVDRIL